MSTARIIIAGEGAVASQTHVARVERATDILNPAFTEAVMTCGGAALTDAVYTALLKVLIRTLGADEAAAQLRKAADLVPSLAAAMDSAGSA